MSEMRRFKTNKAQICFNTKCSALDKRTMVCTTKMCRDHMDRKGK